MTSLSEYKKAEIKKVRDICIRDLTNLYREYVVNYRKIYKLNTRISIKYKMMRILRQQYIIDRRNLINEYIRNINEINALTSIPEQEQVNEESDVVSKNALLVGINYNGTSNQLSGCINDTKNIQQFLTDKYLFKNFELLTDVTEKKPTKNQIIDSFTNLLVNSKKGDKLVFSYSGHGTYTKDLNNDELDGQDELIVPLDAVSINTCISDDELSTIIKNNLKEGVQLFMLADCCFSGTVLDLKYNYLVSGDKTVINPNIPETSGNVIMISGCRDDQTSADAYVNYNNVNEYAGAMTTCFLLAMKEFKNDVPLKQLLESMRTLLKENNFPQIPQLSCGREIDIKKENLQL